MLGLRSVQKASAEMVYGSPLTLPGQFLDAPDPPIQEFIQYRVSISKTFAEFLQMKALYSIVALHFCTKK